MSDQTVMTKTQLTTARIILVLRAVSLRIVKSSAMQSDLRLQLVCRWRNHSHRMVYLLSGICVQLDVSPAILLATVCGCIVIQRFIRPVADGTHARAREAVLLHQVLLNGVGT